MSKLDLIWGFIAPILALFLRDPVLLSADRWKDSLFYVVAGTFFAAICFIGFRLSHSVSRYFSVRDALTVVKASAVAVILTAIGCFLLTRLDNIPRSIPIIHFIVLAGGNIAGRASRYLRRRRRARLSVTSTTAENVIVVGVSDLSWFYIQIIEEFAPDVYQVVSLIDDQPSLQGRFVHGYPVAGKIQDIEQILDEYVNHGVHVERLIVAADISELTNESMAALKQSADARNIAIDFLPDRLGLHGRGMSRGASDQADAVETSSPLHSPGPTFFWKSKRACDLIFALLGLTLAVPFAAVVSILVLIDCGTPVTFWQVRIGRHGQRITISKFRTLKAPYDSKGARIPQDRRVSSIGRFLRNTHLDEMPQLLSIVMGDMSFIGPRPLLPVDLAQQSSGRRFLVRPGITGWAQVHGATLLNAEEKDAMDEWYVRHASWKTDLMVLAKTIRAAVLPVQRDERAIEIALVEQNSVAGTPDVIQK